MRVTLDTAILIRTTAKATGPARELLLEIQALDVTLVLSPFILNEVQRVLRYPRIQAIFHLDDREIALHIELLQSIAEIVEPLMGPPIVVKDPADDPIVYTAMTGCADVLCTVDRHFYDPRGLLACEQRGIRVLTDLQLLDLLRQHRYSALT